MLLIVRRCVSIVGFVTVSGCAAGSSGIGTSGSRGPALPPSPYTVKHCKLDVALEPATHRLEATVTLTIAKKEEAAGPVGPGKLYVELHGDLGIDSLTRDGSPVSYRRLADAERPSPSETADSETECAQPPPAVYQVYWAPTEGTSGDLVFRYGGKLFQDVEAGEKPGEIHNFQMSAHIGRDGIYLSEDGAWYPRIFEPDEDEPTQEAGSTQYELTATEVPGMVLVACGNREGAKLDTPRGERTTWRSPFPIQGMALVGGPHQVFQRRVGDVLISIHVTKDHASFSTGLLDAFESYLKLYRPLIGEYPYREFTFVENFFSSGFAFPGFTLLASAVVAMGPMGLEPGYVDHEMLHNWWGNGVFLSALDGNWCECLTSYCANYMRHVLEGRHTKARNMRRNTCYGLSRVTAEKDKPLGDFGKDDGPSQFIGYQKGAMVFAMLAHEVGEDVLWRAFRRLYDEQLGKPTGWNHIRQAVEKESGQDLESFFESWIRGHGVPDIAIDEARYDQRARRLTITILQEGESIFDVTVPIRLVFDDGTRDEVVRVNRRAQVAVIKSLVPPKFVELDPDFRVMRRVPAEDLMPTISGIGASKNLIIVRSESDGDAYATVADVLRKRYEKAKDTSVREIEAATLTAEHLEKGHAVLLGKACLTPLAQDLLKGKPLSLGDGHFSVGQTRYDKPTQEVMCSIRNEHDPGGVIFLYCGNKTEKLKKAGVVTFYGGNSLVVFEDGKVAKRQDFERIQRVAVKTGS